ncbi:hypothetical protein [Enterococcus diestrammenae]|uniref:hypothetical protein n=1 Tax=Enterococcus diestrammenae TaxID=1155073 RepID=UPI00195E4422
MLYQEKNGPRILEEADLIADAKRLALKKWEDDRNEIPLHYTDFVAFEKSFVSQYYQQFRKVPND